MTELVADGGCTSLPLLADQALQTTRPVRRGWVGGKALQSIVSIKLSERQFKTG